MALTDANSNAGKKQWGVPFKPGQVANPAGRPKGSRNKLGEAFVADLQAHWKQHGMAALDACLEESAAAYCRVVAQVIPKEVTVRTDQFGDITDEQLAIILAAARSALGIIEGSGEDITDKVEREQAQDVQAVQEAG